MDKQLEILMEKKKELERELINCKSEIKQIRLNLDNNGSSRLIRVSGRFDDAINKINNQREENGLDKLSKPKMSELMIRHLVSWKKIENDIILFNINLEENGGIVQDVIA